ncbi:MAG: hypothetical protein AAGA68_12765 [Pseudomonadota bacterium]
MADSSCGQFGMIGGCPSGLSPGSFGSDEQVIHRRGKGVPTSNGYAPGRRRDAQIVEEGLA